MSRITSIGVPNSHGGLYTSVWCPWHGGTQVAVVGEEETGEVVAVDITCASPGATPMRHARMVTAKKPKPVTKALSWKFGLLGEEFAVRNIVFLSDVFAERVTVGHGHRRLEQN